MQRRIRSLILFLAIILVLAVAGVAAAWAADGDLMRMEGQGRVDRGGSQSRLTFTAEAIDGSGYRLQADLMAASPGRERERSPRPGGGSRTMRVAERAPGEREARREGDRRGGERERGDDPDEEEEEDEERSTPALQPTELTGLFNITGPNMPAVSGQATGQLEPTGFGSIAFIDDRTGMRLEADLAMDAAGKVELEFLSPWPWRPAPAVAPSPAAPTVAGAIASEVQQEPGDHAFWYLARAAGLSAYLMLFLNVCLGLAVRTRYLEALMARWQSLDLHRFSALLSLGLLALHGVALLGDSYVGFTLPQLLVPLASLYRPIWTALGVLSLYLFLLVAASSYLRKRIGHRAWRAIHYAGFLAYLLALGHGVMAGTDTGQPWAQGLYWTTGTVVALLMAGRLLKSPERTPATASPRQAASESK